MKSVLKKDKRGVLGLDTAKAFILVILVTAVIAFAAIIALDALLGANTLTTGSQNYNRTETVLNNVTEGVAQLFSDATTWFTLLSIVIIILIISVVIISVNRFGGGGARGGL